MNTEQRVEEIKEFLQLSKYSGFRSPEFYLLDLEFLLDLIAKQKAYIESINEAMAPTMTSKEPSLSHFNWLELKRASGLYGEKE